jgi:hypothetical protein
MPVTREVQPQATITVSGTTYDACREQAIRELDQFFKGRNFELDNIEAYPSLMSPNNDVIGWTATFYAILGQ